jgi:hypothetical protein
MRAVNIAAFGMALTFGAAYQSRAAVILDHGTVGRPLVETGGHAIRPDASPPAIGFIVIDPAWLTLPDLWLWSPVFATPLLAGPRTLRALPPLSVDALRRPPAKRRK